MEQIEKTLKINTLRHGQNIDLIGEKCPFSVRNIAVKHNIQGGSSTPVLNDMAVYTRHKSLLVGQKAKKHHKAMDQRTDGWTQPLIQLLQKYIIFYGQTDKQRDGQPSHSCFIFLKKFLQIDIPAYRIFLTKKSVDNIIMTKILFPRRLGRIGSKYVHYTLKYFQFQMKQSERNG